MAGKDDYVKPTTAPVRPQMKALDTLLAQYRPGSHDEPWTWADERADLWERDIDDLIADIASNGIREPILLGNDGRVWDGHHRVCIATWLSFPEVPVVYA